jgi:hypothetical protein
VLKAAARGGPLPDLVIAVPAVCSGLRRRGYRLFGSVLWGFCLITKVTKVREVLATVPVTCQQPSVGK